MKKIRILFVCKHNMFRSKVAEAYFKKINTNKNVIVTSAGVIRGDPRFNKKDFYEAKKLGITLFGKPKGLSIKLVKKQDMIIIVANDISKNIFDRKAYIDFNKTKIILWRIEDNPGSTNSKKIEKIIVKIMKKVDELNSALKKKK